MQEKYFAFIRDYQVLRFRYIYRIPDTRSKVMIIGCDELNCMWTWEKLWQLCKRVLFFNLQCFSWMHLRYSTILFHTTFPMHFHDFILKMTVLSKKMKELNWEHLVWLSFSSYIFLLWSCKYWLFSLGGRIGGSIVMAHSLCWGGKLGVESDGLWA